ncbi:L,D-transpeptidase [Haloferula helveola]
MKMLLLLAAAICLASCSDPSISGVEVYKAYDRPTALPKQPSQVRVKVSTARQRVYVMEGSTPLLIMPVSVGTPATPTPHGNFRILRKVARHRSDEHGYAYSGQKTDRCFTNEIPSGWSFKGTPMPYWCEFKSGHAFHTGWIKHTPCTNGSIRMHENLAPKFFQLVKVGTPVEIATTQPEDSEYANIPLPPDAGPLPDYDPFYYIGDAYFTDHKSPSYD